MKTTCPSCGARYEITDRMTATQAARVLARRAAAAPSPARQAASRANGRKGGRPRRRQTTGAEVTNASWAESACKAMDKHNGEGKAE